jgi:hypothetical protein
VDLKAANFNTMRVFDPELVLNTSSWEELISKFTKSQYLINSKKFRLTVLSVMEPKAVTRMWEYITYQVYKCLIEHGKLKSELLCGFASDELLFLLPNQDKDVKKTVTECRALIDAELPQFASFVKVDAFRLKQLDPM